MHRYWMPVALLVTLLIGCENSDFANPWDVRNLRTHGAPDIEQVRPASGRVTLTWIESGLEGIEAYQIYRNYILPEADPTEGTLPGELIGTVPADREVGRRYEFVDDNQGAGLIDDHGTYVYRIAYVAEGQTIPNPTDPPLDWPSYSVIPSAPPTPPAFGEPITLGDSKELELTLFWIGYKAPLDIGEFRVYMGPVGAENLERVKQLPVDPQFPDPTTWFFRAIFDQDGVRRAFRIAAVDKAGVESESPVFELTSPNLPPPAPPQVVDDPIQHLFSDRYDISIRWQASLRGGREIPDVVGYRIYATFYDISNERLVWQKRQTLSRNTFSYTLEAENPIAFEGNLYYKDYYVVAYDNTPREDGSDDESPLPPLPELVPPQGP